MRVTDAAHRHDRTEHQKRDTHAKLLRTFPLSELETSVILHRDTFHVLKRRREPMSDLLLFGFCRSSLRLVFGKIPVK